MFAKGFLKLCMLNLLKRKPRHGYEMMKELEKLGWKPSPGSVYPILASLKEKGLISLKRTGTKKRYFLTKKGKALMKRIVLQREEIFRRARKDMSALSKLLGENMKFPYRFRAGLPVHQDIMVPAMRVARKLALCLRKDADRERIKSILLNAEKEIDKLLTKKAAG